MKPKTVTQFELYKKLQEAVQGGSYLVAVTQLDKSKKQMNHFTITNDFPKDDIIPAFQSHVSNLQGEIMPE